jgi:proteasome lid subunit RPN8/RPN11
MTPFTQVFLPPDVEEQIRRHGEDQYPLEACGAILGCGDGTTAPWRVSEVRPAPNEHDEDRKRRYQIPPEFQLRVEAEARAAGRELLGYYHSHPDHPARPSEYDRSHAWESYLYIICSIRDGRAEETNAFTLEGPGGVFRDVRIRSDPGSAE